MAVKSKECDQQTTSVAAGLPGVYYPLHSLLHTLRTLESHGDQICTLLTDIQRTGKVSASVRRELENLMHELPAQTLDSRVAGGLVGYGVDRADTLLFMRRVAWVVSTLRSLLLDYECRVIAFWVLEPGLLLMESSLSGPSSIHSHPRSNVWLRFPGNPL